MCQIFALTEYKTKKTVKMWNELWFKWLFVFLFSGLSKSKQNISLEQTQSYQQKQTIGLVSHQIYDCALKTSKATKTPLIPFSAGYAISELCVRLDVNTFWNYVLKRVLMPWGEAERLQILDSTVFLKRLAFKCLNQAILHKPKCKRECCVIDIHATI